MADVQITDLISEGVFASRPAAADAVEYYATDTKVRYYSDGATWTAQPPTVETHVHSGADITSGTVVDARLDAALARDSEVAAAYQPLDSDLTAIAALTTTSYGRAVLALANQAALLALLPGLDGLPAPAADVSMNTHKITGVVDPTSNQHAATKKYVDDQIAGVVAGGALLGITSYAPGSDAAIGTRNNAALAAVDATNLSLTFTVPASGKVIFQFEAMIDVTAGSTNYFGILDGGGGTVHAKQLHHSLSSGDIRTHVTFYLTGLTPGSATWRIAYATDGGHTMGVYGGPTYGDVLMWATAA